MSSDTSAIRQLTDERNSLRQRLSDLETALADADAARERLHRFETAAENMQVGLTITDPSGTILYTNPAEAVMHGFEVAELLGNDVRVFAPPELHRPMISDHKSEVV